MQARDPQTDVLTSKSTTQPTRRYECRPTSLISAPVLEDGKSQIPHRYPLTTAAVDSRVLARLCLVQLNSLCCSEPRAGSWCGMLWLFQITSCRWLGIGRAAEDKRLRDARSRGWWVGGQGMWEKKEGKTWVLRKRMLGCLRISMEKECVCRRWWWWW